MDMRTHCVLCVQTSGSGERFSSIDEFCFPEKDLGRKLWPMIASIVEAVLVTVLHPSKNADVVLFTYLSTSFLG